MVLLRILRLRIVLVAMVAIALLWWGRGWSLREAASPSERPETSPSSGPESSPGSRPDVEPGVTTETADEGAQRPESTGGAVGAAVHHAETERESASTSAVAESAAGAAADADRRGAEAEQVQIALRAGHFGEAFAALSAAGADAAAIAAAERALQDAATELGRAVRRGAYHEVRAWLVRSGGRTCDRVGAVLDAFAERNGWPRLAAPGDLPAAPVEVAPAPAPPLGGRLVRLAADARSPARVLEVKGDKALLRVLSTDGVTFPERQVYELEPDAVTADEAAELGLAAAVAGNPAAARIWAAIACGRSSVRSSRLAQLLDLLPNP